MAEKPLPLSPVERLKCLLDLERELCRCKYRPGIASTIKGQVATPLTAASTILDRVWEYLEGRERYPVPKQREVAEALGITAGAMGKLRAGGFSEGSAWMLRAYKALVLVLNGKGVDESTAEGNAEKEQLAEVVRRIAYYCFRPVGLQASNETPSFLKPERLGSQDVFSGKELNLEVDWLIREHVCFAASVQLVVVDGGASWLWDNRIPKLSIRAKIIEAAEAGVDVRLILPERFLSEEAKRGSLQGLAEGQNVRVEVVGFAPKVDAAPQKKKSGKSNRDPGVLRLISQGAESFLNPALQFVYFSSQYQKQTDSIHDQTLLAMRNHTNPEQDRLSLGLQATPEELDAFVQWLSSLD